jgi:hypothetical protein
MSLLVDPDYAIYALRLAYLRKIDDHAGPRVITFPSILNLPQREIGTPSRTGARISGQISSQENDGSGLGAENSVLSPLPSDSHVVIAGLNDARYQPELATLHSPKLSSILSPSEDAHLDLFGSSSRNNGEGSSRSLPQAELIADGASRRKGSGGLKYTSTILGPGRTGALGMRVNGRRALNGDGPRRLRPSSRDGTLPEIETVEEQASDVEEDTAKRSFEGLRRSDLPTVQLDSDAEQDLMNGKKKSQRSSSFRTPDNRNDHNLALASFRNRSSSQPYYPATSSGLRSVGSVDEEENTSASQVDAPEDEDLSQSTPRTSLPPSRPPRSSHLSEPLQVQQRNDSISMSSAQDAELLPLRRRSASEGTDVYMRQQVKKDAQLDGRRGEVEEDKDELGSLREEGIDTIIASGVKAMSRMNSDSTILSLASPLNTAKRDLSPRSKPIEYDPHRLSPMSSTRDKLASYQLTVDPSEISSPATSRYKTISSSPLSRRAMLSGSLDGGSHLDGNNASTSSSNPLGNSSGYNSIGKTPSLLYENTYRQLAATNETLDDSLEGQDLSHPADTGEPLSSALGLDVAWTEDVGKSDAAPQATTMTGNANQRVRDRSPLRKISHQSAADHSPSQRRTRSDAQQQQQQWFASLKADQETVARRFQSQPQRSGLSALLMKHSQGPSNPFAAMYKHVAGGSVSGGSNTTIEVYFPFASQSKSGAKGSKSMTLTVRKDASMEEIIGYSLYCYIEEDWKPKLDESLTENSGQEEREVRMSTLGWTLRIVEDGEVDDDYPAIDRSMLVGKFGADELAICEATATQIKQHLAALPKIERKMVPAKQVGQVQTAAQAPTDTSKTNASAALGPSARLAAAAGNITAGSLVNFGGTPIFASSALSKSVMPPTTALIFLRVLITPTPEVRYKTTLQVPSDMYLADILETICRKRHLTDVDQWAFVVPDQNIVVPLDRTIESLQGNHDLALVRRQDLGHQAGSSGALTGQSRDPNASIFKRISVHNPAVGASGSKGIASTYKSYTVNRKQASFLGRHERILTIDGEWIHIM